MLFESAPNMPFIFCFAKYQQRWRATEDVSDTSVRLKFKAPLRLPRYVLGMWLSTARRA